jgi:CRISPR-associated protein Csm5
MVREGSRGRREFELYRVRLAATSRSELQREQDPAQHRGEVHALLRNGLSQEAVLPGSSIKGAMRTAIVNACASYAPAPVLRQIRESLGQNRRTAWQGLEERVLDYQRDRTERDPLRFLRISDGSFSPEAVRVDRVLVRTRHERGGRGVPMHFERLVARCDGAGASACHIRVALAREWMRHPASAARLELTWDFLVDACEAFYRRRYSEEQQQFPWLQGQWLPESPPGGFVLRVGRFCHFESLSVDGLRSGWNVQARQPIAAMGASRSAIETGPGKFAPFGWLLLEPAESL